MSLGKLAPVGVLTKKLPLLKVASNSRTMSENMPHIMNEKYLEWLNNPSIKITLAVEDITGKVVGMGIGRVDNCEMVIPSLSGRIDDVWIEEAHRRKGICKLITRDILDFFEEKKVQSVSLDYVLGNDEAEGMWLNLGFKPVLTIANADLRDIKQRL